MIAALEETPADDACVQILVLLKPRRSPVSAYGFTRREARVAAEIANGNSVQQTAINLNIAEQTVRKHLRKRFEKTGTGRQAELVGMLQSGVEVFAAHVMDEAANEIGRPLDMRIG